MKREGTNSLLEQRKKINRDGGLCWPAVNGAISSGHQQWLITWSVGPTSINSWTNRSNHSEHKKVFGYTKATGRKYAVIKTRTELCRRFVKWYNSIKRQFFSPNWLLLDSQGCALSPVADILPSAPPRLHPAEPPPRPTPGRSTQRISWQCLSVATTTNSFIDSPDIFRAVWHWPPNWAYIRYSLYNSLRIRVGLIQGEQYTHDHLITVAWIDRHLQNE